MRSSPPPDVEERAAGARLLARTFALLHQAAESRGLAFRSFALASTEPTSTGEARPAVRTVVLRSVDPPSHAVTFWTDRRTAKVAQLSRPVEALFWDPVSAIQLRLAARAQLAGTGQDEVAALFDGLPDEALHDYASERAPGAERTFDASPFDRDRVDRDRARANFLRVTLVGTSCDLLELRPQGHRRFSIALGSDEPQVRPIIA